MSDEYRSIIHNIRNMNPVNEEKIEIIKSMTDSEKMEILETMNMIIGAYRDIINAFDMEDINNLSRKKIEKKGR